LISQPGSVLLACYLSAPVEHRTLCYSHLAERGEPRSAARVSTAARAQALGLVHAQGTEGILRPCRVPLPTPRHGHGPHEAAQVTPLRLVRLVVALCAWLLAIGGPIALEPAPVGSCEAWAVGIAFSCPVALVASRANKAGGDRKILMSQGVAQRAAASSALKLIALIRRRGGPKRENHSRPH
jgi:hypothetical protein